LAVGLSRFEPNSVPGRPISHRGSLHPAKGEILKDPSAAAEQFIPGSTVGQIREYGHGNVHDTFLVTPAASGGERFILQRLNQRVFPQPQLLLGNLAACTAHMRRRLLRSPLDNGRRWEPPRVLPTREGRDHFIDAQGSCWRALSFIEAAQSLDTIRDAAHAREVGCALGLFHHLLSDLAPERLADTLPGFHVTPRYLNAYDAVLARSNPGNSPEINFALQFVSRRRHWAGVLERARERGRLQLRPIHGDPKVNNVMIDTATGQAVSLVDLDTVKPGLVHYDIGDCLRSGCNPLGEETSRWEEVRFEADLCRAILTGYLSQAGGSLTAHEYAYLYPAVRLIAFELGLRFFTDYLAGNVYFKARHRDHNLRRALVQFQLAAGIEAQESTLRLLIRELART
jgi:Ser/Thr protein kinase RdoA (MazF antagonist)